MTRGEEMLIMPAICDNCNTIFPSGFPVSNGMTAFIGCTSGPCPKCKGMGHVPDGEYSAIDNIIKILKAPERSLRELKSLAELLENEKRNNRRTPEELAKQVGETIPELSHFATYLANADYKFWFSILLSTIYFIIPFLTNDNEEPPEIEYNTIINHIYESNSPQVINIPTRTDKIGRNNPCTCGSGLKYKRCHGIQ